MFRDNPKGLMNIIELLVSTSEMQEAKGLSIRNAKVLRDMDMSKFECLNEVEYAEHQYKYSQETLSKSDKFGAVTSSPSFECPESLAVVHVTREADIATLEHLEDKVFGISTCKH